MVSFSHFTFCQRVAINNVISSNSCYKLKTLLHVALLPHVTTVTYIDMWHLCFYCLPLPHGTCGTRNDLPLIKYKYPAFYDENSNLL